MKKIFGILIFLATIAQAEQPFAIEQNQIDAYKVKLQKEAMFREYLEYAPYVLLAAGAGYIGYRKLFAGNSDCGAVEIIPEEKKEVWLKAFKTYNDSVNWWPPFSISLKAKYIAKVLIPGWVVGQTVNYAMSNKAVPLVRKWLFWEDDVEWFLQCRTSLPKVIAMLKEDTVRLQNESSNKAGDIAVIATAVESMFKQIEYLSAYIEFAFDIAEKKTGKKRVEDQFSLAHTLYTSADAVAQVLVKAQDADASVFEYAKLNQAIVTLEKELKYTVHRAQQAVDALKWLK